MNIQLNFHALLLINNFFFFKPSVSSRHSVQSLVHTFLVWRRVVFSRVMREKWNPCMPNFFRPRPSWHIVGFPKTYLNVWHFSSLRLFAPGLRDAHPSRVLCEVKRGCFSSQGRAVRQPETASPRPPTHPPPPPHPGHTSPIPCPLRIFV